MKTKLMQRKAEDNLNYRTFSIRIEEGMPSTWDEETRSVEVIGATEEPVEVFDYGRYEVVREVLLMSGLEMSSRQVPLLDCHRRYDTASVLGSYREMKTENGQLLGRVYFSSVPEAESPCTKVREGHLTDFSAGYKVIRSKWVPDGETAKIQGRSFEGPVKVATRWKIGELSCVPIGADGESKARSDHNINEKTEVTGMDEKTRKFLESRGLAKDATEEEAYKFLSTLNTEEKRNIPATKPATKPVDIEQVRKEATGEERNRIREIDSMCSQFDCADMAEQLITDGTSVDKARKEVMDHVARQREDGDQLGHREPATIQADERDKFRSAAEDSILIRTGEEGLIPEKPAVGADDLTGYSLKELARHALKLSNQNQFGHPLQMVGRALTTSDFPIILANIAHKSLFAGWGTTDETWQVWCGTGNVNDFKIHTEVRGSEVDDLEEVPESTPYKYGKRAEAKEEYQIATYGKLFAISRQTIINDDLGALTNIPALHGEAASRKVGDIAYAVLIANSAMGDGKALFHADHGNFVTPGADPGVANIADGILKMKSHKDLLGKRRLNIRPYFFLAAPEREGSMEVFFRTEKWDDVAKDATRNNPYAGKYFSRVYEPRLSDSDPKAWYLLTRKGKTVKVFFLNGVKKPYMETKRGWSVDGIEYKVRIDAGAKAMDWKGLFKNKGE
jgi:hypothetical protein